MLRGGRAIADSPAPVLVVVTGPPGSGKTTLARRLANDLQLVLISKDDLKLILYDSLGWGGRDRDRQIGTAALELMFYIAALELTAGRSIILESNFRAGTEPRFHELIKGRKCEVVQIRCIADRETLIDRLRARAGTRHPGYCDEEWLQEPDHLLASGDPIDHMGELIELNTTAEASYESVLSQVESLVPLSRLI